MCIRDRGMSGGRESGRDDKVLRRVKNKEFFKKSNFWYSEWSKRGKGLASGYLPHILSSGAITNHIQRLYDIFSNFALSSTPPRPSQNNITKSVTNSFGLMFYEVLWRCFVTLRLNKVNRVHWNYENKSEEIDAPQIELSITISFFPIPVSYTHLTLPTKA